MHVGYLMLLRKAILTIILLGSCTEYGGYKPLVDFTKNHRATLIKLFNLSQDIRFPSTQLFAT